eukprot:gene29736-35904_t
MRLLLILLCSVCLLAFDNDREFKELEQFTQQIGNLTADFLNASTNSLQTLPLSLDLTILHHVRDERWKQGGSWDAIAYADLSIKWLFGLSVKERRKHRLLLYALLLHKARLLINVGEFTSSSLVTDQILYYLHIDVSKAKEKLLRSAALFTKGRGQLSAGHVDAASVFFKQTYTLNPCIHQAYYQHALALSSTRNTTEMQQLAARIQELLQEGRVVFEEDKEQVVLRSPRSSTVECVFDRDEDFFVEIYKAGGFLREGALLLTTQLAAQRNIVLSALHWALFLLLDKTGQPEEAWEHLMAARALESQRLFSSGLRGGGDEDDDDVDSQDAAPQRSPLVSLSLAQTQQTLSFFKPGFWPLRPDDFVGSLERTPLFIVGFFRSGSTLLESLLGVHDAVRTMGEHSPFTFRMYDLQSDLLRAVSGRESDGDEDEDALYLHRLRGPLTKHADILLREMQAHFTQSDAYQNITGEAFPFPGEPPASAKAAQRIVDKMLLNFRNIALIHLMFPQAVILHTVRDPLDTLLSCLSNRFGDQSSCSLQVPDMVLDYVLYLQTMHHFYSVLPRMRFPLFSPAGQNPRFIERSALVDVRYEELVANPAKVMRRVFDIVGLEMPPLSKLQRFHDSGRPVHTASFLQVKRPLYASSVGKWKKYAQGMKDTVVKELKKHLPALREKRALPYEHDARSPMNWGLDEDFDYMEHLNRLA